MGSYSTNALKRWSSTDNDLPSVDDIRSLHVYDFDNTLFASPLPNKQIWQGQTIGMLQSQNTFTNGGWWHDSNILRATGKGIDTEEPRAWQGWWNEQVVTLVELSMQQKDAVNVLLTGRSERGFAELIQRMAKSRKLEFDMIVLRPEVGPMNQKIVDTMHFKQLFLEDLIRTYTQTDEIRLFEDRVKHVAKFREFFSDISASISSSTGANRRLFKGEVIEVAENATSLDPLTEVSEVQRMINAHNTAFAAGRLSKYSKPFEIKRNVLYTGYLIKPDVTKRLLMAARLPSANYETGIEGDYRMLANNIMITPRPCPQHILEKVGGLGSKFRWRAVAVGNFDQKVWAMRVEPVPANQSFYFENQIPMVVLGTRGMGKPIDSNRISYWDPLPPADSFEFDTEVGEKVLLRIEEERPPPNFNRFSNNANNASNANGKRPRQDEENFPPLGAPTKPSGAPHQSQGVAGSQGPRRDFSGAHRGASGGGGYSRGRGGGYGGQKLDGRANQGQNQRGRGGQGPDRRGGGGGGYQRGRGAAQQPQGGGSGRGRGGYASYRDLDTEMARNAGKENHFGGHGANDLTY